MPKWRQSSIYGLYTSSPFRKYPYCRVFNNFPQTGSSHLGFQNGVNHRFTASTHHPRSKNTHIVGYLTIFHKPEVTILDSKMASMIDFQPLHVIPILKIPILK